MAINVAEINNLIRAGLTQRTVVVDDSAFPATIIGYHEADKFGFWYAKTTLLGLMPGTKVVNLDATEVLVFDASMDDAEGIISLLDAPPGRRPLAPRGHHAHPGYGPLAEQELMYARKRKMEEEIKNRDWAGALEGARYLEQELTKLHNL